MSPDSLNYHGSTLLSLLVLRPLVEFQTLRSYWYLSSPSNLLICILYRHDGYKSPQKSMSVERQATNPCV